MHLHHSPLLLLPTNKALKALHSSDTHKASRLDPHQQLGQLSKGMLNSSHSMLVAEGPGEGQGNSPSLLMHKRQPSPLPRHLLQLGVARSPSTLAKP